MVLLGAVLAVGIVIFIGWWRLTIYPFESTDDANLDGIEVGVSSEQAGRMMELLVDEGSVVKAGDPLFVVDDAVLASEKERSAAMVMNARDRVQLQRIDLELSERDFVRARREFEGGVISPEMMDHVQKRLEASEAELQAALSFVDVQLATLQGVEVRLAKCTTYAPCDGVIAKKWHDAGDVIGEGQTVLSLCNLGNLWVTAYLEETKLELVRLGQKVRLSLDAYPHREFMGEVMVVGAAAASQFSLIPPNNASGNFTKVTQRIPIRISLGDVPEKEPLYLRPGMSVGVKIRTR
jgi:membrane fusion protein (multidrug efflux system)